MFPKEKEIFPEEISVAAEQVREEWGYLRPDNSRASGSHLRLCAGGGEETGGRLTNTPEARQVRVDQSPYATPIFNNDSEGDQGN